MGFLRYKVAAQIQEFVRSTCSIIKFYSRALENKVGENLHWTAARNPAEDSGHRNPEGCQTVAGGLLNLRLLSVNSPGSTAAASRERCNTCAGGRVTQFYAVC